MFISSTGKDNKGKHFIFGFMNNVDESIQESRQGTELSNKGIEIIANEEITVYAVNKANGASDAFAVFPLDTLGYNYYVITWSNSAEFMIIATEENTNVNILVADETYIRYNNVRYSAGKMLKINMNKFQTFHVYDGPDYTGTRITSNEPITVISGASCTSIGSGACDHLSSQMTPVETFDQSSRVVSSSKPIAIAFFSEGGCGTPNGDPSMILLQPIQQFAADYTFTTIEYPTKPFNHALTINCSISITVPGDIIDNDCDGLIDEELKDGKDNDGDGKLDEDLATYVEELESRTTKLSTKELPTTEFSTMELPTTEFLRTELPTTEFSTTELSKTKLSTISMSATSTRHFLTTTFIKTFASTTTSRQPIASGKLTTTSRQSTTTLPSTSSMQMSNKDECAINPCLNGGTCSDEVNYYNCTCAPGYTGNNCQTDINECFSNTCLNGGTCSDMANSFVCTCQHGFVGQNCKTELDECKSDPCKNNGTRNRHGEWLLLSLCK
ncbi:uncharacterized protein LOC127721164 [Mytilus californianus]|uniref:uncharacterized protein LOC127721164 n=1 Tax=Mytilus californianus TaxID=6549 RepID=UPI0022475BC3|nr:uncharacterized protein LOC127721164 [Mytilus californianus]